jgi:hypothetical protein
LWALRRLTHPPASDATGARRVWSLGWPFLVVAGWAAAGIAFYYWIDGLLFGGDGTTGPRR